MTELLSFYQDNWEKLLSQITEHLGLTLISVLLACVLSLPLGIWISKNRRASASVLGFTGVLQTIPSIALLGFLIPILGIGVKPAIFALFLYSLLPIVRNVFTGISGIDPAIIESARAMGMSERQVLFKVELPLAMPTIFAGIRTAAVINVGVATLAAYIAAGGLGEFIFGGIALNNSTMILAGALPAAILAILIDFLLGRLQKGRPVKMGRRLFGLGVVLFSVLVLMALGRRQQTALNAGFTPEFIGRSDGLPALANTYGLSISNVVLGPALMYKAIYEGDVDVISGYSTDGRIRSYDLMVLEDDQKCFPPYEAGLLFSGKTLEKYPILLEVSNLLDGKINDSLMTHLNYLVDHEKQSVREVAMAFLKDQNLYRPADPPETTLIIGSKIFTEQYILTEVYKLLIEGHTGLGVETKNGLGGTKICLDALLAGEIDMYPEYSGTALQVILNEPLNKEDRREEVFEFVRKEMQSRMDLHFGHPLGFNNTYALMMRREQAEELGINSVSELHSWLQSD